MFAVTTGGDTTKGGAQAGALIAGIVIVFALLSDAPLHGHRVLNMSIGIIALCAMLGWFADGGIRLLRSHPDDVSRN